MNRPSFNASVSSDSANSIEMDVMPSTSAEAREKANKDVQFQDQSMKPALRDSRFCFNFTKYETFIYIIGIFTIAAGIAKIVIIILNFNKIHDELPEIPEREAYYFCGIGICFTLIVILWEFPLLVFVNRRKLTGMKHWMFAAFLHLMGSSLAAVITGARYQRPGMFLSLSFVFDFVRAPAQMYLVHQFIMTEKLDEDSHHFAAYYKKF